MKISVIAGGVAEQRSAAVYVEQEGAWVALTVDESLRADALLTPAQARAISTELLKAAESADQFEA